MYICRYNTYVDIIYMYVYIYKYIHVDMYMYSICMYSISNSNNLLTLKSVSMANDAGRLSYELLP